MPANRRDPHRWAACPEGERRAARSVQGAQLVARAVEAEREAFAAPASHFHHILAGGQLRRDPLGRQISSDRVVPGKETFKARLAGDVPEVEVQVPGPAPQGSTGASAPLLQTTAVSIRSPSGGVDEPPISPASFIAFASVLPSREGRTVAAPSFQRTPCGAAPPPGRDTIARPTACPRLFSPMASDSVCPGTAGRGITVAWCGSLRSGRDGGEAQEQQRQGECTGHRRLLDGAGRPAFHSCAPGG